MPQHLGATRNSRTSAASAADTSQQTSAATARASARRAARRTSKATDSSATAKKSGEKTPPKCESGAIRSGTKPRVIVHVNQHNIKANAKDGGTRPVFSVKKRGKTVYGHVVAMNGPSVLVYHPEKPLSCGARAWLVTYGEVEVDETPV